MHQRDCSRPFGILFIIGDPRSFINLIINNLLTKTTMNKKSMKGACWPQGKETYACSSLGFQRMNECVTINCEKEG